jgi:hypothetical protein
MSREPDLLPIAVRAYAEAVVRSKPGRKKTQTKPAPKKRRRDDPARRPHSILVLDCETTIDSTQALLVACYRYYRLSWSGLGPELVCVDEGLVCADDLDQDGFALLERYVEEREPSVDESVRDSRRALSLRSRSEFVSKVLIPALSAKATVVGFNLPFDLSRLAVGCGEARARGFEGGFSLRTAIWEDDDGRAHENRFQPRLLIRSLDSKRARLGLGNARPGSDPDAESRGRGAFLDLRTLSYALSGKSHSLESASDAFEVSYVKREVELGVLSPELIDYCFEDVAATAALYQALVTEYERWRLKLAPTRAYSPASMAKATFREAGIRPLLDRQPSFPKDVLGYGMVAYFGGRAECRIRRVPIPISLLDFRSMYPTDCSLMGLSRFLTCARVKVTEEDPAKIERWLTRQNLESCFDQRLWSKLPALVLVQPSGDILPVRARYARGGSYGIGVNPFFSDEPVWVTLADALASRLLIGRTPKILRCLRLTPVGRAAGIRPFSVRSSRAIDSTGEDVFRAMVEERYRLRQQGDSESLRSADALKTVANSGAYGIFAELNRQESRAEPSPVRVFGLDQFDSEVSAVEESGEFFFSPLAALVTGAARLMLALLECSVAEAGGAAYAFCDTDSMAIVSTKEGGLVPCPGGAEIDQEGRECVRALSWPEVERIAERFEALNPYDRSIVPGSILRAEPENFDLKTGEQRELTCYAISAKRYCLYVLNESGGPDLVKYSEHALGGIYLNPLDPKERSRDWIRSVWEEIVRVDVLDLPPREMPWLDRPALSQFSASHPRLLRPFAALNEGRPYCEQIKPHGFLLVAHVAPGGYPRGVDPKRFALVAPYEPDPRRWRRLPWRNVYDPSGSSYRLGRSPIEQSGIALPPGVVGAKTYRDVLEAYRVRTEAKSLGPDGQPCGRRTEGLLSRRPVRALSLTHVGKEANLLEEVAAGVVSAESDVQVEYRSLSADEWGRFVLPVLREMNVRETAAEAGISPSTFTRIRTGARPHEVTRDYLARLAARHARRAKAKDRV